MAVYVRQKLFWVNAYAIMMRADRRKRSTLDTLLIPRILVFLINLRIIINFCLRQWQ